MAPARESVEEAVRAIVARVRDEGDPALAELTRRFDTAGAPPPAPLAHADELAVAKESLDPELIRALELALENVTAVAAADVEPDTEVTLRQGQRIVLRGVPVRRAAVYVPGGRAPYPSTVVMGAGAARAVGVEQVVVCSPPGPSGDVHPAILGACALVGVDEVVRAGGAHGVAALAYGTQTIDPVDVIVGPGNLYVQEAKRQLFGTVGIDGFAGPSDVLVLFDASADVHLVALDLLAQGEHGAESLVLAVSADRHALDELEDELRALAPERPTASPAAYVLVATANIDAALALSDAFAPEHLELVGATAEQLAAHVRSAGCVFVGRAGATAFGDYVAGSNHVLPTDGAARFASTLSPRHFRRRMAEVHLAGADSQLAEPGAAIARAEGFVVHAESMEARIRENDAR